MANKLIFENVEYILDDQNQNVKNLALRIDNTDKEIEEKKNIYAVFTRAKKSYI